MLLLLKSSLIIALLLAFYKVVLESESFFSANRVYLLACLLLAGTLPFVALPDIVQHQGIVSELTTPFLSTSEINENPATLSQGREEPPEVNASQSPVSSEFVPPTEKHTTEVPVTDQSRFETATGIANVIASSIPEKKGLAFWIYLVYFFVATVLLLKLLSQVLTVLLKLRRTEDRFRDGSSIVVNLEADISPCSFFNYIFINPSLYDKESYEQILTHEKIHVSMLHSIDLVLAELAIIALWFNPFVWLFRKEIEKNIEYQTDDILVNGRADQRESYQLNLLNIACPDKALAITTNYNQSLIKQRILKMNAKKSSKNSYWKFAFLAPFLFATVLVLNSPTVASHETERSIASDNETGLSSGMTSVSNDVVENLISQEESSQTSPDPTETVIETPNEQSAKDVIKQDMTQSKLDFVSGSNDCGKLTRAIRKKDIDRVRELLSSQNPDCVDPNPGYEVFQSDEEGLSYQRRYARTPLTTAARVGSMEIAQELINAGAEVDFRSGNDAPPLTEAAYEGFTNLVLLFMRSGADIKLESGGHGQALSAAASRGHLEIVEIMLDEGADINLAHGGHGSALNSAAWNGQTRIAELLVERGAKINMETGGQGSALSSAAWNGHTDTVELLLRKGAEIDLHTGGHGSALNSAAWNGHSKTLKLLLDKGADVNLSTGGHGSALNSAAWNNRVESIKILLDHGAKVNLKTGGHGSALNSAAWNGNTEAVLTLLNRGADINLGTSGHGSALNSASWNGHEKTVDLLISRGADVNLQTGGHGSALNSAAWNGHAKTVELLISKGADVNLQTGGHGSALNSAAWNGHDTTVDLLIKKGAKVNLRSGGHGSALNSAAWNGRLSTVKLLVSKGADINLRSGGQGSALDSARRNGHQGVIGYLKSKGAH